MVDESLNTLRTFMRRLFAGSQSGSVEWSESGEFGYTYERPSGSVYVGADSDGTAPYTIQVYDGDGRVIDEYRTRTRPTNPSYATANEELYSLYSAIRRKSLKVDEVLGSLMNDLPDDPNPWASDEAPF